MNGALLIRADADTNIGIGHVMRCLTLAAAWRDAGGDAVLLGRCRSDWLLESAGKLGICVTPLAASHPDPSDLTATLALLEAMRERGDGALPWLVLDGYFLDGAYQTAARQAGFPVLVVDDYTHLPRYDADVLLNQNLGASSLEYDAPGATLLLGPTYALIRPEFVRAAAAAAARGAPAGRARNVLVTLGGGDPANVTAAVLRGLRGVHATDLRVRIVAGPNNPHAVQLRELAATLPMPAEVSAGGEMVELMLWADVAVAAAGSTNWELAFMGVPTITVVVADNQRALARELADAGVTVSLGWHGELTDTKVSGAVTALVADAAGRAAMRIRGRALVDGAGATRVVHALGDVTKHIAMRSGQQ